MESKAIDPVDFREAQHQHWDSAAVGWNEWSEFNDGADGHISERLVELADVQSGSRVLDVAAGYGEPALTAAPKAGRRAALWRRTSPARCSRSGVNARRRPAWATSSSWSRTPPASIFRTRASTPLSRAGGSSSSLTRRPPRGASEAFSSRARGWRSARGASPIRSPSSRFR
jgi:hypothetical protein